MILGLVMLAVCAGAAHAAEDVNLTKADRQYLLDLARATIQRGIEKNEYPQPDEKTLSEGVKRKRGCFVTIWRKNNHSEGSAGVFGSDRPLYENVIRCTAAAAWDGLENEWRLLASGSETLVTDVFVEISLPTKPADLSFVSADDLLAKLQPSKDGVILYTRHGSSIAMPYMWRPFPEKADFLTDLCLAHGAPLDAWKKDTAHMRVQTFRAAAFSEKEFGLDGARNAAKSLGAVTGGKVKDLLAPASAQARGAQDPAAAGGARFRNLSGFAITSAQLGPSGTAQGVPLRSGASSAYVAFAVTGKTPGGEPVAVGSYRLHGGTREIYVPSLPKKATIVVRGDGYRVEGPEKQLPLWPYPQRVALGEGACDIRGKALFVPAAADEKTMAIAETLASSLARYLKLPAPLAVRKEGDVPSKSCRVVSIGVGPDAWPQAAAKCSFENVLATIRSQAFHIEITPEGIVLGSPGARGLSYGALVLMQLARGGADGTRLGCATIDDWPDMEMRVALASSAGYPIEHRYHAGRLAWEGRLHVLCWGMRPSYFIKTRPEWEYGPPKKKEEYLAAIEQVRAWAVEIPAGHDFGIDGWRSNHPYAFMNDNETYFRAMREAIDERLEVVPTRYFKLGMDEEYFIERILGKPRPLEQFRHVASTLTAHLRRKGVTGMIWTDVLYPRHGGNVNQYGPAAKDYDKNIDAIIAGFPGDLILVPWYYWVKKTEDAIRGCDIIGQAKGGGPVLPCAMGPNTGHHVAAVLQLREKYPNLLGVMGAAFGGRPLIRNKHPRHPYYVEQTVGPLWKLDAPAGYREGFAWETEPKIPSWECLLYEDPPESIDEALVRLADPSWRVWMHARERLVGAGLSAAPALLAAMSKAEGDTRDRIEGCLSRSARSVRQGRNRGALDAAKVLPYLADGNEAVRDMAAELLASCAEDGPATLRAKVKDPVAGASCVRALGIVEDGSCVKDLIEVLSSADYTVTHRAEAARVLGVLRAKDATKALRAALTTSGEKDIRGSSLWALALVGCTEADKEIAAFLESDDDDLRYRAAIALTLLKSPERKKLVAWLSKDRISLEVAAWSIWKSWGNKKVDAVAAVKEAMKTQKDPTNLKRLEQMVHAFAGTGDRQWRF